jgi:replicative DNA helicase
MPQAVDMEEAVLGACLIQVEAPGKALDIMKAEMFYKEGHEYIFSAIERMYDAGDKIDILTVTNHLKERKTSHGKTELELAGGAYYISQITSRVASAANIEFHCRILVQKWVLRRIIVNCSRAVNRSYNEDPDIFDVLDEIGDLLLMRDKLVVAGSEMHRAADLIGMETEDYNERVAADKSGRQIGVRTGFVKADRLTTGWQNGTLIVTAARPGMGKTAFIVESGIAAARSGIPVGLFSLEMKELKIMQRIVTQMSEVDNYRYKRGWLDSSEMQKLDEARSELLNLPFYIDDTPGLSITALRTKARRMKQKYGVGMIIVDYLQLMSGTANDKRNNNREQEIASISRGLKACSMELDIPVHALSQLSRAVEARGGDKRPQLSDLRESGAIEQDADTVMFIHRPEYYIQQRNEDVQDEFKNYAELIFAKNREGSVATIGVEFLAHCTKFRDAPGDQPQQMNAVQPNRNFYEPNKEEDPF